jgi:ribose/xylose/arabinose/galactoside ABC-type transport system permease subunit
MITGLVYVFGKVPIVITTIGMTLLYESLTYLVFDGKGVTTFYSNSSTSIFGRIPLIFIPTALAVIVFIIFNNYSVVGRKNKILANNQLAGVNIGISERKSVLWSYFYSGLIVGFAAIIYVSQNSITPQSGLSTAGIMFSYIVPVFMGLFIGKYSQDFIGIIVAAIGMQIMYYGLETINLVGGWQQIIMGLFVFGFYAYSSQYDRISKKINDLRLKIKKTID